MLRSRAADTVGRAFCRRLDARREERRMGVTAILHALFFFTSYYRQRERERQRCQA